MYKFKSCFKEYINQFLAIRSVSVAEETYKRDEKNLQSFDDYYFEENEGRCIFNHDAIIDWQLSLQNKKDVESKINTVRLFLQFYSICSNENVYIPQKIRRKHKYVPYIFTDDEFSRILEYTDNYEKQTNFENSMILRLLYGCGLRINETLCLKMKNIFLDKGILYLQETKFHKERIVPMHPSLVTILEQYCIRRKLLGKDESFLFANINGTGHITRDNIIIPFKKAMKYAGIQSNTLFEKNPGFHSIRHTFTVKSNQILTTNGFSLCDSIPFLSFYLGHNSIFETDQYLNFGSEMFPLELSKFENQSSKLYPEAKDDI